MVVVGDNVNDDTLTGEDRLRLLSGNTGRSPSTQEEVWEGLLTYDAVDDDCICGMVLHTNAFRKALIVV